MKLYRFTNEHGQDAAVNLSEIGDMHQDGKDVYVRWGGSYQETTRIPNTTLDELIDNLKLLGES